MIALYNPASKARPGQIAQAFAVLSQCRSPETIVMLARAVGRPDEDITVTTLAGGAHEPVDMRTLVMIGSSATRLITRGTGSSAQRPWVYTPRSIVPASIADKVRR